MLFWVIRMPFGMCNAYATFQRAIPRAQRKLRILEGSMVMASIDDIAIATEIASKTTWNDFGNYSNAYEQPE